MPKKAKTIPSSEITNALLRSRAHNLHLKGVKRVRIAEQIGVSPTTVTRWLRESGVEPLKVGLALRNKGDAPIFTDIELTDDMDPEVRVDEDDEDGEPEGDEFEEALSNSASNALTAIRERSDARADEVDGILAVAENQASPADKYQAFVAANAIRMFRDNMANIRGPRTVKEMSELDQMIRRNLGLNPKGGSSSGSVQIDISILNNTKADIGGSAIPRRVVDADILDQSSDDDD